MDNSAIKNVPTIVLIQLLSDAYKTNNQVLVNIYSYELSYRVYKMDKKRFMDILKEFGYNDTIKLELKKEDK